METSRTLALLCLALLVGCPGQDGGSAGGRDFRSAAPPEAVKTGYLALVGACAAGNAEALWAQLTPRLQQELEATSGALRSLDADSLKRLYAHEAGAGPFDGKALLRGAVGAAAAAGELCKDAHRWEVLDKGFAGDGYLYAVGRSDAVVHGLLFAEAGGGWKVDEIIRSRRADPPKQTVSAAPAADPAPEPDPQPQPPTLTRAQRIQRWLSSKLKGHDNNVASFRVADITESGGGYRIYIKNQFKFTCTLEFDQDGNPSRMRDCRSPENWTATPSKINLSCTIDKKRELCRGLYKLGSGGYRQRAHFQFFRILSRAEQEALEAAPPDPAADPAAADPAAASTTPARPAPPS
ncbi:MAG: hypothetical protein OXT09_30725, partial [Myxococcales bacterium]|nr:hypothetical protein [Myxococcales bacterium]